MLTNQGAQLLFDHLGADYATFLAAVDTINADLLVLQNDQIQGYNVDSPMGWVSPNLTEAIAYQNLIQGLITNANTLSAAGVPLGNLAPNGLASNQNGFWKRGTAIYTSFNKALVGIASSINQYGTYPIINIPTFLSNQGVQVNSNFASLYWFCFNGYLPEATVFAPSGISTGSFNITGTNTGTLTTGSFPTSNGYSSPAPSIDGNGNSIYVGGMPMAQGFAPCHSIVAHITTAISGTCAVTVHAPNQAGVSKTWTGTLDSATLGANISLTPTTGGDYIHGAITAIDISGTATTGAFSVNTVALR